MLSQSQQQLWVLLPLRYSFLIVQSALVSTGVGVKAGTQLLETGLLVALVGQRQQPLCFQGEHLFVLLHKSLGCVFCLAWSCGRGGVCGGPVTLSCVAHPHKESICHPHSLWATLYFRKRFLIKFSLCLCKLKLCDEGQSEQRPPLISWPSRDFSLVQQCPLGAGFPWWATSRKQGRCDTIMPKLQLWKSVMALQTSEMWP